MQQLTNNNHSFSDSLYFSDDQILKEDDLQFKKDYPQHLSVGNDFQRNPISPIHSNPSSIEQSSSVSVKQQENQSCLKDFDLADILSQQFKESLSRLKFQLAENQTNRLKEKNENGLKEQFNDPAKIEDQNQVHSFQKKNRKIRTTVNQEKIKIMEYLFPYISGKLPYKGANLNLKDISQIVDLGYSTILHKYKAYRIKGEIEKGLLIKCKNTKRKYGKSKIIESFIQKALSEKQFKTAKQLANFITEIYHYRVNRSIISRHLNQMQRQKNPLKRKKTSKTAKLPPEHSQNDELEALAEFQIAFFRLKNYSISFYYFTTIRMYLIGKKFRSNLEKKQKDFKVINLVISAQQDHLTEFDFQTVKKSNPLTSDLSSQDEQSYIALYRHFEDTVQSHNLDFHILGQERVYIIFPFKNTLDEHIYRQLMVSSLLKRQVNIITVPPLQIKNLNFIQAWFEEEVLSTIQGHEFESFQLLKSNLSQLMDKQQNILSSYYRKMEKVIRDLKNEAL